MKRIVLAALAALVSVCVLATAPATTTVTYTVADPSTTPPAQAPVAYAVVTWSATTSPAYLNRPISPSYNSTTGVLTWTLPQSSQVRFQVPLAYPAINDVYALGTAASYSLNDLVPVSAPAVQPAWAALYIPYTGATGNATLGNYKFTAKYFNSGGYPTASLPSGIAGDLAYDTTRNWFSGFDGYAWYPFIKDPVTGSVDARAGDLLQYDERTMSWGYLTVDDVFGAGRPVAQVLGYSSVDNAVLWYSLSNLQPAGSYLTSQSEARTGTFDGPLVVRTGQLRWYPPAACTLVSCTAYVGTAPTGAAVTVNVKKNGSTILASDLSIAAGANASAVTAPTTTTLLATDYLTWDIDTIGSTEPGRDITVRVIYTVP